MELLVVAGADAGSQYTIEGDEVLLGRGQPGSGQVDAILLDDKSISRKQAWIRRDASGTSIEHIPTAANATFLNGAEISRARLSVGDRIEMGRVAIDVRERAGMNLSGLSEIIEGVARGGVRAPVSATTRRGATDATAVSSSRAAATAVAPAPGSETESAPPTAAISEPDAPTDIRPVEVEIGELRVVRGIENAPHSSFPIGLGILSIGRGEDVDIQIPEAGVSRLHAELEIRGRTLELIHRSGTNPTFVNGFPVVDRMELENGDEIQLADRAVLRVHLAAQARSAERAGVSRSSSDLSRRVEHKLDLEREIAEFSRMGSFVDVDVVDSRRMKSGGEKAEHIIVSFDRFRAFVSDLCAEFGGQVLNSNGDELMCFFEDPAGALLAGSAILERLDGFNREANLLGKPFRFRIGVHTGVSLVDLRAGVAYSDVLDTAGHIQKQAEPNSMWLSQQTVDSVPKGLPVTPAGELAGDGTTLYRVERFLRPEDVATDLGAG